MVKRNYVNLREPRDIPADAPVDQVKIEFANRLQRAMAAKGWNQSETARRAADHMPVDDQTGKRRRFGRDNLSHYIRAVSLPGPIHLNALSKALGVPPDDLLPTRGMPSADDKAPAVDLRSLEDGNVWLRVNQAVSVEAALNIVKILKEHDGVTPNQ